MRTDEQFYYPNTDEGKEAYTQRAVEVIDDMKERLDSLFFTKPEADLIVKRGGSLFEKNRWGPHFIRCLCPMVAVLGYNTPICTTPPICRSTSKSVWPTMKVFLAITCSWFWHSS